MNLKAAAHFRGFTNSKSFTSATTATPNTIGAGTDHHDSVLSEETVVKI
jgi:hypothetical protein